ncbi:MAG TPA: SPFH domain-containing protein [Bacillota bacterium]|nr:SPFH domain-containing protein [Bacillota bacterium]
MGVMDFIKSQFIEVIEWTDQTDNTIAYRFPVAGNEIKMGAQLIVRESQAAVFINEGVLADVFKPNTYTLSTENMPVLTKLKSWKYGFNSPFKAEVYFINTKQFINQKWGTSNPVMMRDPEFGMVRLRAFGTYSYKIEDPAKFLKEIMGTNPVFETEGLAEQMKSILISGITDFIAEAKIPVLDLASQYREFGEAAGPKIQPLFDQYGIKLMMINIENISLPEEVEKAMDKRTSMGVIGNMQQYTQYQTAEAIRDAAQNPGGNAGTGMGFGAGMAMGQAMMNSMNFNNTPSAAAANQPNPAAAPGITCPKCNTLLPAGAKFCSNCGSQPGLTCPKCNTLLANGAKFCSNCGSPIGS